MIGAASGGVFRSRDQGKAWLRVVGAFPPRVMRLCIATARPDVIWAGMEVNGAMFIPDGDGNWREFPLPEGAGAAVAAACG